MKPYVASNRQPAHFKNYNQTYGARKQDVNPEELFEFNISPYELGNILPSPNIEIKSPLEDNGTPKFVNL